MEEWFLCTTDPAVLTLSQSTTFCIWLRAALILWFQFSGGLVFAFDFLFPYQFLLFLRTDPEKRLIHTDVLCTLPFLLLWFHFDNPWEERREMPKPKPFYGWSMLPTCRLINVIRKLFSAVCKLFTILDVRGTRSREYLQRVSGGYWKEFQRYPQRVLRRWS